MGRRTGFSKRSRRLHKCSHVNYSLLRGRVADLGRGLIGAYRCELDDRPIVGREFVISGREQTIGGKLAAGVPSLTFLTQISDSAGATKA
jgi:hypothetical protein